MSVFLDLHIQDFVNSYNILNQRNNGWLGLVSKASVYKPTAIATYTSNGNSHLAHLSVAALPDAEWLLIQCWAPYTDTLEQRFDCLRMLSQQTHSSQEIQIIPNGPTLIQLRTRHPGLLNTCFVLHNRTAPAANPWLLAIDASAIAAVPSSSQNL
jgi:hypothetical protein